jgi:hypothetical protein
MAARKLRTRHQDDVRQKIQASALITRLHNHIEGKTQLTSTQLRAIEVLLNKSLPNLQDVKIDMSGEGITFNINTDAPTSGN